MRYVLVAVLCLASCGGVSAADCKDGKCFPTAKQSVKIVATAPVKAVAKVNSERPRLLGRVFGRLRGGCGCR